MFWILVGLVAVFAIAMIFVAMSPPPKVISRKEFLAQIEKHTEGRCSQMQGEMDSYRIDFEFEGHHFWYEDIESEGFTQKVYKGILKIKSNADLNLIFVKKDRNKLLGTDVQMMSSLSDVSINKHSKVYVPSDLKEFDVFTQIPYKINLFFDDKKARSTLAGLKQFDRQGEPFMPISISDGVVFLDLSSDDRVKLNRQILIDNPSVMEKLSDSLIVLVKALDKAYQN